MKVFIAFGYRDADAWIKAMVFPIISAMGSSVSTGEDLYGANLHDGVDQRIQESDGLIAFCTRRDQTASGDFTTHPWVLQETATALARNLPILEVWETKVPPSGIAQDRQRLTYDATKRDQFLVDLVKALGYWHQEIIEHPQLLPQEVERLYQRYKFDPTFRCTYTIMRGYQELPPISARIYSKGEGGLYVILKNLHHGDLVSVDIQGGGEVWGTDFQDIDAIKLEMRKRP